jgi:hypothetical protein
VTGVLQNKIQAVEESAGVSSAWSVDTERSDLVPPNCQFGISRETVYQYLRAVI